MKHRNIIFKYEKGYMFCVLKNMAEKRLFDAAAKGDEKTLQKLLQEDPLILNIVSYTSSNKTPLHVATIHGHLPFVEQILNHNPHLAEELDSQQSSVLHIASAKGCVEIVRKLLSVAPDMCMSRDSQGRNPLHLAAIKGHVQVLEELFEMAPFAAGEKMDRGLNLLHLSVKYNQFEALKILVPKMNELLNSEDENGETILHMTVRDKRIQIIQYLLENTSIDVNAKNSKGQTPMSILDQTTSAATTSEIKNILTHCNSNISNQTQQVKYQTENRDALLVVAVLMATMAFQAGVSPAGGVWQEDSDVHRAGEAIMARNYPEAYKGLVSFNTMAVVYSITAIVLLVSGLPFRRKLFMWILELKMWLTVASMAISYAISVIMVTPEKYRTLWNIIEIHGLALSCTMMGIPLVFGNRIQPIYRWLKNKEVVVWRPRSFRNLAHERASQESV